MDGLIDPLLDATIKYGRERNWKYFESRNRVNNSHKNAPASVVFHGHVIELEGGEEKQFMQLGPAVRRAIRKAENEGVSVELCNNESSMTDFFYLHCLTRRRHGLPPQPLRFFDNIARYLLSVGKGFIVIARLGQKPVAASIFFHSDAEAIYKFGASDYAYQHLRPNNLLMWEAIKHCIKLGVARIHLGRTSISNQGLRQFKLGFGAREERIEYQKYDFKRRAYVTAKDRATNFFNQMFRCLPVSVLRFTGEIIYPHLS